MEQLGIGCIGFVFGYLLYYSVRHTESFDITLLSAALGAVSGEVVIGLLGPEYRHWIGPYGVGLFAGFLTYLALVIYFTRGGVFDKLAKNKIFLKALMGVRPD